MDNVINIQFGERRDTRWTCAWCFIFVSHTNVCCPRCGRDIEFVSDKKTDANDKQKKT